MEYVAKANPGYLGAANALAENRYELVSKTYAAYDPLRIMILRIGCERFPSSKYLVEWCALWKSTRTTCV